MSSKRPKNPRILLGDENEIGKNLEKVKAGELLHIVLPNYLRTTNLIKGNTVKNSKTRVKSYMIALCLGKEELPDRWWDRNAGSLSRDMGQVSASNHWSPFTHMVHVLWDDEIYTFYYRFWTVSKPYKHGKLPSHFRKERKQMSVTRHGKLLFVTNMTKTKKVMEQEREPKLEWIPGLTMGIVQKKPRA